MEFLFRWLLLALLAVGRHRVNAYSIGLAEEREDKEVPVEDYQLDSSSLNTGDQSSWNTGPLGNDDSTSDYEAADYGSPELQPRGYQLPTSTKQTPKPSVTWKITKPTCPHKHPTRPQKPSASPPKPSARLPCPYKQSPRPPCPHKQPSRPPCPYKQPPKPPCPYQQTQGPQQTQQPWWPKQTQGPQQPQWPPVPPQWHPVPQLPHKPKLPQLPQVVGHRPQVQKYQVSWPGYRHKLPRNQVMRPRYPVVHPGYLAKKSRYS